jgi:hypothetical protein
MADKLLEPLKLLATDKPLVVLITNLGAFVVPVAAEIVTNP